MNSEFPDSLTDPAVRDLAWVIGSPVLLQASHPAYHNQVVDDAWCSAQLHAGADWLARLDLTPQALHDFIVAHPTHRLGHYFETLLAFWLQHRPDTQLIASNLQVLQDGRTLGEYDFLFRDADAAVCHWEVAIKFYLQQEPLPQQHAFIGPGTKDRLDLKLKRVFQHQLQLGNTPAGQQALPQGMQLHRIQAYIKGYLFYHAATPHAATAVGVSPAHLSGWWVRHDCEPLPQTDEKNRWIILPRLRWLAPARAETETGVMDYTTLQQRLNEHFKQNSDALLLCEMARMNTGTWRETSRGFVVCSSWPLLPGTARVI